MLNFDTNGYLVPDNIIPTDLTTFRAEFVDFIPDETAWKYLTILFNFAGTYSKNWHCETFRFI